MRLKDNGGAFVQRHIFAGVFLVFLLMVSAGGAQAPTDRDKPVWTMEFLRIKPDMFGFTLRYLDDNWMRVREEAKHQGAVLNYSRIAEQDSRESDRNVVLLTEYKNKAAFDARERLFDSIRKQLPNKPSGVIEVPRREDLFETVSTRVFQDYSEAANTQLRNLAAD